MRYSIDVVILPVSDVDRALAFYAEKAGFAIDVDDAPSDEFRVVQLTPPRFELLDPDRRRPDRRRPLFDARHLRGGRRRPACSGSSSSGGLTSVRSGTRPRDPDGNQWVLQERGYRG
jgi:catechol 2,3-dioxygenase-like lactoylglutathione lyase family enzyme